MNFVYKAFKCLTPSEEDVATVKENSFFRCFTNYQPPKMTDEVTKKPKLLHMMSFKRKERSPPNEPLQEKVSKNGSTESVHSGKLNEDAWSVASSSSITVHTISQEDSGTKKNFIGLSKKKRKRKKKKNVKGQAAMKNLGSSLVPLPQDNTPTVLVQNKSNISLVDYSSSSSEEISEGTFKRLQWSGGSVYAQLNYSGKSQLWLDKSFDSSSNSSFSGTLSSLQTNYSNYSGSSDSLSLPSSSGLPCFQMPSSPTLVRTSCLTPPTPNWFQTPAVPRRSRSPFVRSRSHSSGSVERLRSNSNNNWRHHSPSPVRHRSGSFGILPDYDAENLMKLESEVGVIDTHCHLDFLFRRLNYTETYDKYKEENSSSYPNCYEGCVAVFCDPLTFNQKTMWEKFLEVDGVFAAFGCHPHMVHSYDEASEMYLKEALTHERVVALGEIGLDYSYKNSCDPDMQKTAFRRQLKIALECQLPLVIHCRDADDDCIAVMKEIVPVNYRIHRHCFTGDWATAQVWLDSFPNLCMGITALVTFPSAKEVHEVAAKIPLERLLLETDTPYFVPKVVNGSKWSHPGMVIHVAAQIAAIKKDVTIVQVLKAVRENTKKIYGI